MKDGIRQMMSEEAEKETVKRMAAKEIVENIAYLEDVAAQEPERAVDEVFDLLTKHLSECSECATLASESLNPPNLSETVGTFSDKNPSKDNEHHPRFVAFGRGFIKATDNYGEADACVKLNGSGCVYVSEHVCDPLRRAAQVIMEHNAPDVEHENALAAMTRDRDNFEQQLTKCAETAQQLRADLKTTQGLLNVKNEFCCLILRPQ